MTATANRVRITGGAVDVTVTVTTKDEPTFAVEATEHAVEAGANIIDHARPKLIVLSLEGIVSVFDDQGALDETLSTAAYTALAGLAESPQVVRIETPWRDYPEMLCVSFKPQRSKEIGKSLKFVAEFKQYRVVNAKKQPVEIRQAKKVPKGVKKAEDVKPPRQKSLAARVYDGAR